MWVRSSKFGGDGTARFTKASPFRVSRRAGRGATDIAVQRGGVRLPTATELTSYNEWLAHLLQQVASVHLGMSRMEVSRVFDEVYQFEVTAAPLRACPTITIDLEFIPADKPVFRAQKHWGTTAWSLSNPPEPGDLLLHIARPQLRNWGEPPVNASPAARWFQELVNQIQIVPGMTRAQVMQVMNEAGGLSVPFQQETYWHPACHFAQISLSFIPYGGWRLDPNGRPMNEAHPEDLVAAVSDPYFGYPSYD